MPTQRRYICSFCARAFSRSEHRARHERSHTREKPFSCEKCPSAFVRRDLLQRHMRTVHSKDKTSPISSPDVFKQSNPLFHTHNSNQQQQSSIVPATSMVNIDTPRYKFNEKNIISLLTLSKKFNKLAYLDLNSKVSSLFLVWGTMSNLHLPIVKNDQIPSLDEHSSLLYAILAFGASYSDQFEDCIKLLNKSWILILKSNSNPMEIIQSLTILSHIYLINYHTLKRLNSEQELIPIEIIMDYLDKTTCSLMQSSTDGVPLFNYWFIFLILSSFSMSSNRKPPSCHKLFLSKPVPYSSNTTLLEDLIQLSKSPSLPINTELSSQCLIMGLSNELQTIKSHESCSLNRNSIHNAIIMANKSFILSSSLSNLPSLIEDIETEGDEDLLETDVVKNLIMISKRSLLLSCPLKFQDLVVDYITPPTTKHHWNMLSLTLKEFCIDQHQTLHNLLELATQEEVTSATISYMNSLSIPEVNNNLGLTSLPLLFFGFIAHPPLQNSFQSYLNLPRNFSIPIIETYLILLKILLTTHCQHLDNPIIQSIVYLISEMGTTTPSHIQSEINNMVHSSSTTLSTASINYLITNILSNLQTWLSLTSTKPHIFEGISLSIPSTSMTLPPPLEQSQSQSQSQAPPSIQQSHSPLSSYPPSPDEHKFISLTPPSHHLAIPDRIKLPPIQLKPRDVNNVNNMRTDERISQTTTNFMNSKQLLPAPRGMTSAGPTVNAFRYGV